MPPSRSREREVGGAIKSGAQFLKKKGIAEPRLNAETLLAYVSGKDRLALYLDERKKLKSREWDIYRHLLKRRGEFVPLQYLVGSVDFFGLDFLVDERVLIPRPETEILVELSLLNLKKFKGRVKILDLGTGCGNIALSLAKLIKAEIYATDISKDALTVARENSRRLKLEKRVHFLPGDCFEPLENREVIFQLICSSPPYIPTSQLAALSREVRFEPEIALDGGKKGLDFFRRIIKKAHLYLAQKGYLILEIGENQSGAIRNLVKNNKFLTLKRIIPDYQGIERIVIIKRG